MKSPGISNRKLSFSPENMNSSVNDTSGQKDLYAGAYKILKLPPMKRPKHRSVASTA